MDSRGAVLITGGSGFVAGWCAVRALEAGWRVRVTVRDRTREARIRRAIGEKTDPGERLAVYGADLLSDLGWDVAMAGCAAVLHVASPFPARPPRHESDLVVPARDGTLRVLKAAKRAGVNRIVVTSSTIAAQPAGADPAHVVTEEDWNDPASESASAFVRAKTLAEQAAWTWVRKFAPEVALTAILPGAVLGPAMTANVSASANIVKMLLEGVLPACPRISLPIVDVRCLADLHVRALEAPQAVGQRFLAAGGRSLWLEDIARLLRTQFPARRIAIKPAPDWVVRAAALVNPSWQPLLADLGRERIVSNEKARLLLGWSPRSSEEAVRACAESLSEQGLIKGDPKAQARGERAAHAA